jgi:DNA repair photolyase
LHAAKEAGLHLYVALAPTYPECDEADLRVTLRAVAELKPVTIFHEPINIRADNVTRIRAHAETLGVHLRSDVFMTRETWQDYAVRALRTVERLAREIKQAVGKLPPRKKLALARWLRAQVDDRLSDEEMMAIAAEGARVLDKREAALPNAKRGEVWQIELWPGCQGASGFGPRLRHCGRRLGLGHCGLPHDGSPRFPL